MDRGKTYRTTMHCALTIVGSENALARRLQVGLTSVQNWCAGLDRIPDRIYLATVDIILDASVMAHGRGCEWRAVSELQRAGAENERRKDLIVQSTRALIATAKSGISLSRIALAKA